MYKVVFIILLFICKMSWTQIPNILPQKFIIPNTTSTYDAEVFKQRRENILKKIKGQHAIITAENAADFYYVTGIHHSDAIALLSKNQPYQFVLFIDENTAYELLWNGPKLSYTTAKVTYKVDTVIMLSAFYDYIKKNIGSKASFSLLNDKDSPMAENLSSENFKIYKDLGNIIHEMRVIKDTWEIQQMKQAIEVTAKAHQRILETLKPKDHEFDVRAEIEYTYHKNNCTWAFPSITGSGSNACYLHYEKYDDPLKEGDLILVDIGAKYNGYCGDITRTYPINGTFTPPQREIYTIVYDALKAGTKKMTPQNYFFDGHHAGTSVITRGLYQLGLMTDTTSVWQKLFYIHYRNSHYLGIDVHDVGHYGESRNYSDLVNPKHRGRKLEPGMVLTIEPGLYFLENRIELLNELFPYVSKNELDVFYKQVKPIYQKYAGIGIRLEDDILITTDGHINLSMEAPVKMEDVEGGMR